ncbi:hypothetical protein [Variovorax arabinosiphilus]|uniref:hypothetical protein n=1 Tax=Variovorax arabinosiphilus TaxID=3053498 RepID=UPI0025783BF9|nr:MULTISPECIES: hypothetical protein [unclassified Variovorax]MDM0119012.1 hypothetical protein [Variovorax sp. J2L1-78]MDM0129438.1 hypothetical protein [Variovorax sp. J2L1-63]MDM0232776.1 hypothetical protein [Variovorax sp. J2R1-6]
MADSAGSATVAVFGALGLAYATQFVAEDFKRFREGSAVAAGLAGELDSYRGAYEILVNALTSWKTATEAGNRAGIPLRKIERPRDMYLDEVVSKLGLLGSELAGSTVLVYSNLRAFRLAMELLSTEGASMGNEEFVNRCDMCLERLRAAYTEAETLVPNLEARALASFWRTWWRQLLGGVA